MSETNSNVLDFTGEGKPKLSTGLNVLTILTIIGSILSYISSVYNFYTAKQNYDQLKEAMGNASLESTPAWVKGFMNPEMLEVTRKMYENKLPIMVIGLVAASLCLYGALEMRKLKKQGYILWLAGEVMPVIGIILFTGMASFSGFGLIGLVFPAIFIILYTVYRKDLLY